MEETKRVNMIHYIIVLLFCFGFRFLPPFAGITEYGMGILGPFIGAVYGWIFIDLTWSSLMAVAATALTAGMGTVLAGCFGNEVFICLIVSMLAIGPAINYGAFNWLSMKILTAKALEGKGYLIIFVIFIIAWLFACVHSFLIALIIMGFTTEMFKQVGVKKNDKLAILTYLGIAYQVMRGQILFPFIGTGIVYKNAYNAALPNQPLEVLPYLAMMGTMGIVMTVVFVLLMKYVFRVDVTPLSNYRPENKVPAATREQKISLGFFVVFIALNLLACVGPLKGILSQLGVVGISCILGGLMVLLKNDKGMPFTDQEKLLHMNSLGFAVMIGYIMYLSANLVSAQTGIGNAVAALFMPFITLPPMVFIVIVMVLALVITNLANNMMVAVVCLPFLINFTAMLGMPPMAAVVVMFIITEFALCTPAASPMAALAMGQELVDTKEMMKYSFPLVLILFIVFLLVGWPLANIIF